MATKIDIPGTGQDVDLSSPTNGLMDSVKIVLGFAMAAAFASIGIGLCNRAAQTPDSVDEIEVI